MCNFHNTLFTKDNIKFYSCSFFYPCTCSIHLDEMKLQTIEVMWVGKYDRIGCESLDCGDVSYNRNSVRAITPDSKIGHTSHHFASAKFIDVNDAESRTLFSS